MARIHGRPESKGWLRHEAISIIKQARDVRLREAAGSYGTKRRASGWEPAAADGVGQSTRRLGAGARVAAESVGDAVSGEGVPMSRPWQVGDIVENPECGQRAMITATREGNPAYDREYNRETWVRQVVCASFMMGWSYQDVMEACGWRLVEPRILIPPGTPTHKFDDIPDDDLLANREGHPYT